MNFFKKLLGKPELETTLPDPMLIKVFSNRGEFDRALTVVDSLIRAHPERLGLYLDRAQVHLALKNWDKAIEDCTHVLATAPDAAAYVFRGNAYNAKEQFDRAADDFSKASEFGIALLTLVYTNRAFSYLKTRNYNGVISDCTLLLMLVPDMPPDGLWQTYINRAMAYRYLDRFTEALEDCDRALSLPIPPERRFGAYYNRGAAHLGLKRYQDAADDFTRALELNNAHFETYAYRGYVFHLLRRFDDALADIEKALRLNPRNVRVWNSRAAALQMKGAFADALASAESAIQLDPEFVYPYLSQGYALFGSGRYPEALASFQKAAGLKEEIGSRESAALGQSLCHYALGEREKALEMWRSAAEKNEKLKNIDTLQEDHRWHENTLEIARKIISEL